MKQFYYLNAPDTLYKTLTFTQPVRKCMVLVNRGGLVRVSNTGAPFYIPAGQAIVFDLQSVNTGKGVTSLQCKSASSGNSTDFYFSIVEYGFDGDNEFFV